MSEFSVGFKKKVVEYYCAHKDEPLASIAKRFCVDRECVIAWIKQYKDEFKSMPITEKVIYPIQFQMNVVNYHFEHPDETITSISEKFAVEYPLVIFWIKKYEKEFDFTMRIEIVKLRNELKKLKEEVAELKGTNGFNLDTRPAGKDNISSNIPKS